ncbi:MAG: YCF48-related protein [Bacteroidota bacterium]|nr:YCF48-related protein [Bacteroidota bacterium]
MNRFTTIQSIIVMFICSSLTISAQTWTMPASYNNPQNGCVFLDANNAVVVGGSTQARVRNTTDGGITWSSLLLNSYYRLNAVCFTSTSNGYAVGDVGTILHTTDGGATWAPQSNPVEATFEYLFGVSFYDASRGIAVGSTNTIIWTSNGSTWNTPTTNPGGYLNGVSFYSATNAIAVGTGGTILKTTDGGVDWTTITPVNSNSLVAVNFFNGNTGIAVGATGTILRSTDGGDSWVEISAPATSAYRAISFYNTTNGVIVGDGPRIAKTTDGGLTWTNLPITDFTSSTFLLGVSFIDQDNGIALGSDGTNGYIYQTTNGNLPVELISFTATAHGKNVELKWNTATEVKNYGFEVERKAIDNGQWTIENWGKVGFVEGNGTTNAPKEYSFSDKNITAGKYSYRLKQIDRDGKFEYSSAVEVKVVGEANTYEVSQNYPNPFNPNTVISYQLPVTSAVTLTVFDAIGREVATLVSEVKEAGTYSATFDGSKLSSGIYFYTLRAGNFTATKKLTLMK